MGQVEVLDWLVERRKEGDDYFTAKQVIKGLQASGSLNCPLTVYGDLTKLAKTGHLEVSGYDASQPWKDFTRKFRAKKKFAIVKISS